MQGDRERCIDAGMDDYVAKPVRSAELYHAIENAADGSGNAPPLVRATGGAPNTGEPEFDAQGFRDACGSSKLMADLIQFYQEDTPPLLDRIAAALEAGDADALHQAAHSLKGLVGNYAATGVHAKVTEFDNAARSGDITTAKNLHPEVVELVSQLSAELAALA